MGGALGRLTRPHGPGLGDAGRLTACAAAIFSIGAGIIHISAAADHENLPVMMVGFLVIGTLQVGLGGLLIWRRPDPLLIVAALALMLGSVGVWLISRTSGLPFLPGGHMEPIGFKDGICVLFELAAVPGLLLLISRDLSKITLPSERLGTQMLGYLGAASFMLFVPALLLDGGAHHSHGQLLAMHSHDDGHSHGDAVAGSEGHEHADGASAGAAHEHDHGTGDGLQLADAGSHSGSGHSHTHGGGVDLGDLAAAGAGGHQHGGASGDDHAAGTGGHAHGGGGEPAAGHEHGGGAGDRAERHDHGGGHQPGGEHGAPGHEGAEPGHGSGEHGHGGEEPAPPDNGMTGFEDPGTLQWGAHRFDYEPAQPGKDGKVGTGYAMVYRGPSDPNNGTVGHHAHGDCSPTPEQQTAADKLYKETWPAVRKYDNNLYGALADGFTYIFPLTDRIIHMVNVKRVSDPTILDPDQIESFLYVMTDDGLTAIGGMYVMPERGMPGPQIGGCLTRWHEHAGAAGRLTTAGTSDRTAEMLHVWTYPGLDPWAHYDGRSLSQLSTPGSVVPSVCRETGDASDVCLP